MKRYQSPLFLARLLRIRYSHLHISQRNMISLSRVAPTVYVRLMPDLVHAGHFFGSRQYSNGFHALDRFQTNFDDGCSNGGVDSKTSEDFHQLDNSYEHFKRWSIPRNHNPVNEGTNKQHLTHDYVEKGSQQNLGFLGSKTDTGFQQVNGHWGQQYPSNIFTVNAEGHQFGGYQQENSSVQPSLNAYNSTYEAGSSTGGHSLGSRQYSNGFHALDRFQTNSDDCRSNGGVDSKTPEDFHQLSNSCEHFQQWSNSGNHNPVNEGTNRQHHTHDYVEKGSQQNLGFSGSKTDTGFQQVNGHWGQRYPSHTFTVNAEGDQSGGYQQENSSVQPSLNAYNSTYEAGTSTGGVVESALKELNDLCEEWDLLKAVECMKQLSSRGVGIDLPRYLTLIEACGEAKALEEAKAVHEHLLKFFSPVSTSTFNRILDMYGKCGSMNDAYDTFNNMPERNLTSWDKMISWYAKNGLGEEAIDMFTKFKEAGMKPDGQMFIGLFDACGVVGDVTEGMLHFDSMSKTYGITPTVDHYASIVRMFGSAGDLDGALDFIEKMPVDPNVDVWESLMNISRIQGNVELGDRCAQIVDQFDASRLTNESKTGLIPIKDHGILKKKVKKTILSESRQHEYRAGDRSHPETEKIYALLRGFRESMKEAGYVPETRFVLHDIDQEEKEEAIMAHSERLAAAYFLLTSTPRTQMRIIKNLRVCGDCHNVFKIISKLVGRRIIMRDHKRFHHFDDGKCSCNDYW